MIVREKGGPLMKTVLAIWSVIMASASAGALEFKAPLQDIRIVPEAKTATADFEFTNKTGKEVVVKQYKPLCDCTTASIREGKLRYAPGESGVIRTELKLENLAGVVDKMIAIWIDDDPEDKPSVSLTMRVHIPVLVQLEPKSLTWQIGGKCEPQTMRIRMNYSKPIHIKTVTTAAGNFNYGLKTVEHGKLYELTVTPEDCGTVQLAIFSIETDCDIAKYQVHQAFCAIQKPLPVPASNKP